MSDKQFVSYDDANTVLSGYAQAIKNADGSSVEKATYDTTPATKPHSTDDFIYFNDTVYKVTSAIAIGDTIAVGTNISVDTGLSADTQMYIDGLPGGAEAPVGDRHTVNGNPLSFTTDSAQLSNKTIVSLEPIQAGSGDPSPSNVRAISGYDNVRIIVPRKNQFNKNDSDMVKNYWYINRKSDNPDIFYIESTSVDTASFVFRCKPSTTYTISKMAGKRFAVGYVTDSIVVRGTDVYSVEIDHEASSMTYTTEVNSTYLVGYIYSASVDTATKDAILSSLQIEEGSEATTYEPYNPATDITIPAPDGTIYGGTLDVENGLLTVTHKAVNMGDLEWTKYINDNKYCFQAPIDGAVLYESNAKPNWKCSCYKIRNTTSLPGMCNSDELYIGERTTYSTAMVKDSNYTDASTFKTAVTGQKLVYELATPKTYRLSPHQVKLLQGANTVTTNGTSLSLTYRDGEVASLDDMSGLAESVEGIGSIVDGLNRNITNNDKGASVDISGYNSPNNSYTFSSDGYIYLAAIETGASVTAVIGSVTGVSKSFGSIACVYSNGSQRSMTFVRKGMTTYCASGTGNYICQFAPIV